MHTVACTAVNDAFVMQAWSKSQGADGKILMLGKTPPQISVDFCYYSLKRESCVQSLAVVDHRSQLI